MQNVALLYKLFQTFLALKQREIFTSYGANDCTMHLTNIYLFKVNNSNTRQLCEMCSNMLTVKTLERR